MKQRYMPSDELQAEVQKTVEVLKQGGIILYPTDTLWGIGCDATNEVAVSKIYSLKQRAESKSMLLLIDDMKRIGRYVRQLPEIAFDLVELAESPTTIIYPGAVNLPTNLLAEDGSVGIRVCRHEFCQQLIYRLGRPIVSTSANVSGAVAPKRLAEVDKEIKEGVDYIVSPAFEGRPTFKPSAIVKLGLKGEVEVIRE